MIGGGSKPRDAMEALSICSILEESRSSVFPHTTSKTHCIKVNECSVAIQCYTWLLFQKCLHYYYYLVPYMTYHKTHYHFSINQYQELPLHHQITVSETAL